MRVAIPVLIALTALVAGAAVVRSRSRHAPPIGPRNEPLPRTAPAKPLPESASSTGTQAVRLVGLFREQRALRLSPPAAGFSEEQVRRLRRLDQSLADGGCALSEALRVDSEAWKEVIVLLSEVEDFDGARDLLYRIRGAIGPSSEGIWAVQLRTAVQARDRRLAALALAGRSSRDVVLALAEAAQEDGDRAVRSQALAALGEVRRQTPSGDLARLAAQTLRSCASAEQDPVVRGVAGGLVAQMDQQVAPAPPPARRSTFGRGFKSQTSSTGRSP